MDVVCIGEVLVEFVAGERNRPLAEVSHYQVAPGGAPANVAVALQKLDVPSRFVGCVGHDAFGDKLRSTLSEHGVNTACVQSTESEKTTLVFTAVHDDGHKELCFYRGADRCFSFTPDLLKDARCFHYGSISLIENDAAQRQAMEVAKQQRNLMVSYDPNYRPTLWKNEQVAHKGMLEAFRYAHLAKISIEEFDIVTGHQDLQKGIRAVLDQGVQLLVVSKGSDGALATNGDFQVESPAIQVDVLETTGAGDAMMAALIAQLLPEFERQGSLKQVDKETMQTILDYANVAGGLACTKMGAIPALPTKSEVESFLQRPNAETVNNDFVMLSVKELASMIDHTMLKPYCTEPMDADIEKLCKVAREYRFAMVAIHPCQVETCVRLLQGSGIRVGACIGFPLGQTTTAVKVYETRDALERGANEIDMVLNVRDLQNRKYDLVRDEISSVARVCQEYSSETKIICKVILETCYLTTEQKVMTCEICKDIDGVDFVKTSTGFGTAGAAVEDIRLMRRTVGAKVGVKASGGIRDLATAKEMIKAGANRIGTSSGVAIIDALIAEQSGQE